MSEQQKLGKIQKAKKFSNQIENKINKAGADPGGGGCTRHMPPP
jgi:hypothetical protein